jgi:hypothetical protein
MKDLMKLYLSGANLLSDNINDEIEIEYPDGSKFKGRLKEEPNYELVIHEGSLRKKQKNNNSYFKQYEGAFLEGVPHGKDCTLEIKLSTWPR